MQSLSMKYLAWHLRRSTEQLGLSGVAGLGALAFRGMFYLSTLQAEQDEVKALQRGLHGRRQPRPAERKSPACGPVDDVLRVLPYTGDGSGYLAGEAARGGGGERRCAGPGGYRVERKEGEKPVRHHVVLPLKGVTCTSASSCRKPWWRCPMPRWKGEVEVERRS